LKKPLYLILFLILIYSCGPKQDKVDRKFEIGTEVILNHIEPYRINGEPNSFYLEEELVIDFEREDLSEFGISDIRGFNVDSEGNIYISNFLRKPEYFIYQFNGHGEFVTRFARFGQGPGEAQIVQSISIDNKDRLFVFDNGGRKILVFKKDGGVFTEIPYQWFQYDLVCLFDGSYLVTKNVMGERKMSLSIYNHDLEKAKELEIVAFPNRSTATFWAVSENFIYVSDDKKGYEIRVYDFKGKLIRKIRKEHKLVKLPLDRRKSIEEIYKAIEKQTGGREKFDPYIHWPPLSKFFIDSDERLYIQTWEEGDKPDEYIHDIFNRDGAFIGRVSLNIFYRRMPFYVIEKNGYIYYLREKPDGFMELYKGRITALRKGTCLVKPL